MKFSLISIFPEMIEPFTTSGLLGKAIEKEILQVDLHNLRDFTQNKHKKVDDRPFGGGPGMVMMPQPLFDAIQSVKGKTGGKVILFSAYAKILTQSKVKELAREPHLILVCGRYEGVDQRVIDQCVDEEISIGEYVMMGGEAAAVVLMESVSRMLPGVVGNPDSVTSDSFFYQHQADFPQYTQPREFRGIKIPEILLTGNHKAIEEWRKKHQKIIKKKSD